MASTKMKRTSFVEAGLAVAVALLAFTSRAEAAPGSFDLSSPANGAWCTATCTFAWQSASSATSYNLYIDGALKKAAIAAASSPSYALAAGESIADGWHTWYIVARDSGGTTTQSTSTWSARVDASPPTAPVLVSPAANDWTGSDAPTFTWAASTDVGSGLAGYEVWLNGTAAKTGIAPSATSVSVSLPTTAILQNFFTATCPGWATSGNGWWCGIENMGVDPYVQVFDFNYFVGTHVGSITMSSVMDLTNVGRTDLWLYSKVKNPTATLEIRGSDDSGATWRLVKSVPPTTSTSSWSPILSLDDFTGTSAAKLQFYGSNNQAFEGWEIYSFNVLAVLGGTYTWQVVAVDLAGNRTSSESRQVRYDLPPAPFDLATPPSGTWTANTTPTFGWNATTDAGSGLAKYQLWIDGNLAVDNISTATTTAAATSALADGAHSWQVYAVDAAGAVRHSRETFSVGIDTTPPAAFSLYSPPDQSTSTIPTPTLCWSAATDAGSGLGHYQLFIDGSLNRDGITGTCSTPTATLTQGAHTWSVNAIDGVGNARAATQTWTINVDFNPPTGFVLLTPGNGTTVDSSTPTFTWGASSDTGSGLSHYELSIDGVCVACSIPLTSTTYTLTAPLSAGTHTWFVTAVDGVSGSTVATGAPWSFTTQVSVPDLGPEPGLELRPESGPEPTPEPPRDAGVDAPADSGQDAPGTTTTGIGTSTGTMTVTTTGTTTGATATNTASATVTRTATATTGTVTTTGTSVSPEPRTDAATPITVADAATPDAIPDVPIRTDAVALRDGAPLDATPGAVDTTVITAASDATISVASDGGVILADAAASGTRDAGVVGRDGSQTGTLDGARADGAATTTKASGGCGCVVGGGKTGSAGFWPLIVLGFAVLWRGVRVRRRRVDRD